jgi:SAM-dependent methyltransferase
MIEPYASGNQAAREADLEIQAFYEMAEEKHRLYKHGQPTLEFVRTMELLERLLPAAPATILDVGGGPGAYALALSKYGYAVRVIDASPRHVDEARTLASNSGGAFTAALGDARQLDEPTASCDAVLLLGPLYHLVLREDRLQAIGEAARVVRPNGLVLALGIPRFHSLLDGIRRGILADPQFNQIAWAEYRSGVHRNPVPREHREWFTTAYYHYPGELAGEMRDQGLAIEGTYSVLAPGFIAELHWHTLSPEEQTATLEAIRALEREDSLLGFSDFLVVGRRP